MLRTALRAAALDPIEALRHEAKRRKQPLGANFIQISLTAFRPCVTVL